MIKDLLKNTWYSIERSWPRLCVFLWPRHRQSRQVLSHLLTPSFESSPLRHGWLWIHLRRSGFDNPFSSRDNAIQVDMLVGHDMNWKLNKNVIYVFFKFWTIVYLFGIVLNQLLFMNTFMMFVLVLDLVYISLKHDPWSSQ